MGGILYPTGKKGGARGAQLLEKQFGFQGDQLLDAAFIAFERGMEASVPCAKPRAWQLDHPIATLKSSKLFSER